MPKFDLISLASQLQINSGNMFETHSKNESLHKLAHYPIQKTIVKDLTHIVEAPSH